MPYRQAVPDDDGILVRDLNGNGEIDDVTEMFGGAGWSGFEVLAELDGNGDGKVDALDNGLADFNGDGVVDENDTIAALKVWRDLDQDAVTDEGELFSLADLGIASISVAGTEQEGVFNQGNQIAATGTFTRTDGTTGTIADVWYRVNNIDTRYTGEPITITTEAAALRATAVPSAMWRRAAPRSPASTESAMRWAAAATMRSSATATST